MKKKSVLREKLLARVFLSFNFQYFFAYLFGNVPQYLPPVPELWVVEIFVAITQTRLTSARTRIPLQI
jgi:hypothetical protein